MKPNGGMAVRLAWTLVLLCAVPAANGVSHAGVPVADHRASSLLETPLWHRPSGEPGALFFLGDHRYEAGSVPVSIAHGRFDADDRPDLATANSGGQSFSVLLQGADLAFAKHAEVPLGAAPAWIAAGDANGDAFDDVALVLGEAATLVVLTCDGAGGFVEEGRYPTGLAPTCVSFADLDADGDLDLACTNSGDNTVLL